MKLHVVLNFTFPYKGKCISDCTLTTVYVSFELQAVIAGRQGDLQRSQKLTKIADTCLVVGSILAAVPYFIVVFGGVVWPLVAPFVL